MRNSNRATLESYADSERGRRVFVSIPMSRDTCDTGWLAFRLVAEELRRLDIEPERLHWRYTEENYSVLVAMFEVAPRG